MVDQIIRVLVNLTIPVECLFSIEVMMRTDTGRNTIFDLNKLLTSSKESFTDVRATRAVVDYMKNILEKDSKLSFDQCDSVNNCLLLLRNILHIPEFHGNGSTNGSISMQNQILWNLFSLSIDKLLIHLMSCPQRAFWSGTLVQLIAVMYKDQQVSTLQKLLNVWLEDSLSDSSEDFESNTSPPTDSFDDSSPILTSDPTSDSSDNGGKMNNQNGETMNKESEKGKSFEYSDAVRKAAAIKSNSVATKMPSTGQGCLSFLSCATASIIAPTAVKFNVIKSTSSIASPESAQSDTADDPMQQKCESISELSDCGYVTQVENQQSISTSSNEDNYPCQKIHQKPPCNQKQRYNAAMNPRSAITAQEQKEWRRKKLVKRSKSTL